MTGPRVLYAVNVDWFFLSHRLPLARAARDAGAEVVVATTDTGRRGLIEAEGFRFEPLPVSRRGTNPVREAGAVAALARLYRRLRPDLVHQVSPKPILYGSVAARLVLPSAAVVNAVSGLGFSLSDDRGAGLRRGIEGLYRLALHHPRSRTIFQNPDDLDRFVERGLIERSRTVLIRGSGADLDRFRPSPLPAGPPTVLLATRMLWEKGVGDFVDAVPLVRREVPEARFVLAGGPDLANPTAVPRATLERWHADGVVTWLGHRRDMEVVFRDATLVVLPTYYPEGIPKVLIEAAACGRPIVATDVPGCREIVRPGRNGALVPPRDPAALAAAIVDLLRRPQHLAELGADGRAIAEAEFGEDLVVAQTMALYADLLGARWPGPRRPASSER